MEREVSSTPNKTKWWLKLGLPALTLVAAPLQARDEPVRRGVPNNSGPPSPADLRAEQPADRELTEYLAALEQQNEALRNRLRSLESSAEGFADQIRDRESRLALLSQNLGEKEQLVATILANEEALTEALALRDERVTLLEENLNHLRTRASRAVELEQRQAELSLTLEDLRDRLQVAEQRLAAVQSAGEHHYEELQGERSAHQTLLAAYEESEAHRAQLEEALAQANHSLQDFDGEISRLQAEWQQARNEKERQTAMHTQLNATHSETVQQCEALRRQLAALQETQAQLHELQASAGQDHAALRAALTRVAELEASERTLSEQLARAAQTRRSEHEQWETQERTYAQINDAYQELVAVQQGLQEEVGSLVQRLEAAHAELAQENQAKLMLAAAIEESRADASARHLRVVELEQQLGATVEGRAQERAAYELEERANAELGNAYRCLAAQFTELQTNLDNQTQVSDDFRSRCARLSELFEWEKQQRAGLTATCTALQSEREMMGQTLVAQEAAVAQLQGELVTFSQELEAQRKSAADQESARATLLDQISLLAVRYEQLESAYEATRNDSTDVAHQLELAQRSLEQERSEAYRLAVAFEEAATAHEAAAAKCSEQESLLNTIQVELAMLESTVTAERDQKESQDKAYQELVQAYSELARHHRDLESQFGEAASERLALKEGLAQLTRDRQVEHEQWELQEQSHRELVGAYQDLAGRHQDGEQRLDELGRHQESLLAQLAGLREELVATKRDLKRESTESSALSQEVEALAIQNQALEDQLQDLIQLSRDKDEVLVAARSEKADLHRQLEELSASWQQLDQEQQDLLAKVSSLEKLPTLLRESETHLREQTDRITQLTATMADQQTALASLERTRDSLVKQVSDLEGFQQALLQWEAEKMRVATLTPQSAAGQSERASLPAKRIHIVSPGETLANIAEHYNKRIQDIYNANMDSIPNQNQVRIGTPLIIP
jgi:chromosome segregation ATPase